MSLAVEPGEYADLHLEPLARGQYQAMLDTGILDPQAGVELVDGLLVHRSEAGQFEPYPLTVDQYHALFEAGILPEAPVELLDGLLVRKDRRDRSGGIMTVGKRHAKTITRLHRILDRLSDPLGCHARSQQPVTIPPRNEPEPDVALVLGEDEALGDRHPGPADLALVIEVADSSLPTDRNRKQRTYAGAGIPLYWIVNLNDDVVEVYDTPSSRSGRYRNRRDFRPGETITFDVAGQTVSLPVDEFLTVAPG